MIFYFLFFFLTKSFYFCFFFSFFILPSVRVACSLLRKWTYQALFRQADLFPTYPLPQPRFIYDTRQPTVISPRSIWFSLYLSRGLLYYINNNNRPYLLYYILINGVSDYDRTHNIDMGGGVVKKLKLQPGYGNRLAGYCTILIYTRIFVKTYETSRIFGIVVLTTPAYRIL